MQFDARLRKPDFFRHFIQQRAELDIAHADRQTQSALQAADVDHLVDQALHAPAG